MVISRYFSLEQYYRIEGALYFSFFDVRMLVETCGGVGEAAKELSGFRDRCRSAGVGELHLNAVVWGLSDRVLPHGYARVPADMIAALGFDSVTSYNWFQYQEMKGEPGTEYGLFAEEASAGWQHFAEAYDAPYIPNVTMGEIRPPARCSLRSSEWGFYPFTPVLVNNTPSVFGKAIRQCYSFVRRRGKPPCLRLTLGTSGPKAATSSRTRDGECSTWRLSQGT